MENILAMLQEPRISEITSFDQIEISREEYMNKDDSEKKFLIIKFYNHMVKGKA